MKYRVKMAITVIMVSVLAACVNNKQNYELKDPSQELLITLNKNHNQEGIHYLEVEVSGDLDGVAELTLLLDGTAYRTQRVEGEVKFIWKGDWYADSAVVRYHPVSAKKGKLRLEYEFKGL